jgi:hypothetical protein
MTSSPAGAERELTLRYPAVCHTCGTSLPPRSRAVWHRASKTARCLSCVMPVQAVPLEPIPTEIDFGTAGASAQRMFDRREAARWARLRELRWRMVVAGLVGLLAGAIFGHVYGLNEWLCGLFVACVFLLKLTARPQHIDAWRSGAAGERAVGRSLDALRDRGVVTLHDRRVPGSRANVDHIAVSSAGIWVIDTKNVVGKVSATRRSLRVAGRRQDKMITGVQAQVAVVQRALADQSVDPTTVRGVLCFTRADLPWLRPSPGGVLLRYPRGLRKELRRVGGLTPDRVRSLAESLARRLPPA